MAVRKYHRAHKRLQVSQVASLPLVQHVVWLHEHMSHYVVVSYDKDLRALFKVTPPMFYRLTYGQSLRIIRRVRVDALNYIQLTRSYETG
jgi:hypothetical protein